MTSRCGSFSSRVPKNDVPVLNEPPEGIDMPIFKVFQTRENSVITAVKASICFS